MRESSSSPPRTIAQPTPTGTPAPRAPHPAGPVVSAPRTLHPSNPPSLPPRISVYPPASTPHISIYPPETLSSPQARVTAHPQALPASLPPPRITIAPSAPAGWGSRVSEAPPYYSDSRYAKLSDVLVETLAELGVESAFGLVGGAVAPFCDALAQGSIKIVHCRHEAGAVFAAIESSFVSNRPAVVFTTTGPGITNAITGVVAARRDGAKVILISGSTAAPQRGRWAFQETSWLTMPISGLFTPGPIFHYAVTIEQPAELAEIARRLALGLQQPSGFVAHLAIPMAVQNARAKMLEDAGRLSLVPAGLAHQTAASCVQALMEEPFAIWVGFGARHAAAQIRALAERTGAPVMCSPRGKGIFPEDHPQFVGVTGFGGHTSVTTFMTEDRPAYILVLGTRLGEFTSFWDPDMVPSRAFIHVDIDPEVPGVAYPSVQTLGVQAELGAFMDSLLDYIPARTDRVRSRPIARHIPPVPLSPRAEGPVRPGFLMEVIQRVIVEGSDAVVMTEAGNAFAWGSHALRFSSPARYRVSTGFGSMGHAVTGVIGAALARKGKAVAIAGDGAMLMNSEISTAVSYGIPAVWIVLNDAQYGMIDHGMRALGMDPVETAIPPCDFVMIARGMGADGVRVEREVDVDPALAQAMAAKGPFVVDVIVDPRAPAPFHRRNQSLNEQGAMGTLGKTQGQG